MPDKSDEVETPDAIDSSIRISSLVKYEKVRYQRKGYGLFFAILTNILYFTLFPKLLAWYLPEKVEHPGWFFAQSVFIFHEGIFLLTNLEFAVIYWLNWPFFERYKTTNEPWPWQEDKEEFKRKLWQSIKTVVFNHLVISNIFVLPNLIFDFCEFNTDKADLPSAFELLWQLTASYLADDAFFYWSHRALHSDFLYNRIHKKHHEWKHTIVISTENTHWFEYIFGNLLSVHVVPLLLGKRMHMVTYLTWICLITHESNDGHSGYEFSWSPHRLIPFSIGSEFHYFHHLLFTGNYSSTFTHWDKICNTVNKRFLRYYNRVSNDGVQMAEWKDGPSDETHKSK